MYYVPHDSIVLVPYDPEWARGFQAERATLERVLAPWLEDGIHHIGSTSIPAIAAKPIIDMIAGVRDLEEARRAVDPTARALLPLRTPPAGRSTSLLKAVAPSIGANARAPSDGAGK
jgi:GrpB-like predicted nucleotidyltransferase (UPF0157 family)